MSFNSCTNSLQESLSRLLAFESSISLASDIGGSATSVGEEAGKDRLDEGSEDNLSTIGDRKGHPQNQDKLEDIVKG